MMDTSGATPISLSADSCSANENRCHIATPAPPTPYPYHSPMYPYGAINPFSFMSRYSSAGAAHLQSAFSSPLTSGLHPGLAYPTDIYQYNPYSALTPTSPLTPSSFWSLTAQQSYHQLNGITFGPSGPVSYNTNAHLFNIFSPNSLPPMSPSPDLHSPSLYPRVSSMPSPYASSPGLSSAFMSPSSMPLLLSPSLSSNIDRPPTYLSDNTSTPSTTPSIKCEPIEHNCSSHHNTSQLMSNIFSDNSIDKNDYIERHTEKADKIIERHTEKADKIIERHSKKHNNNSISSKMSTKEPTDVECRQQSHRKTITTTITASKTKEKHSARVEPLMRSTDDTTDCVVLNGRRDVSSDLNDKTVESNDNKHKRCVASPIKSMQITNIDESRDKDRINDDIIKDNKDLKSMNARVKRELIECDISLPSITTDSVPNCNDMTSDSNTSPAVANNTSGSKTIDNSLVDNKLIDDNSQTDDMNLIIDDNSSNSSSSDRKDVHIVSNFPKNIDSNTNSNNRKQSKDAKKESQLKQLQSYRKESHRMNGNKPLINAIQSQPLNGIEPNAAISIVLPKPKEQISGQHLKPLSVKLVNSQSSNMTNQSQASPSDASIAPNNVLSSNSPSVKLTSPSLSVTNTVQNRSQSKAPTCRTKPVPKIAANNSSANLTTNKKINVEKTATVSPNQTIGHKLPQTHSSAKPLPKKLRISQKKSSASIPVGIAIAQQRTSSPMTKSLNDSNSHGSQPLKPILPTLSLPMMANSPILITDSPPAGTSLWIKPTSNTTLTNNTSLQTNSQFSLTGDYQLARDSLTGHIYLIRNSSSLPTTPTTTPKPQTLIPPLTIKGNEHQSKSSPSAILTLPVGAAQPQQFFASIGQTPTSTLILDTTNSTPLVQIAATAAVTDITTTNAIKCVRHLNAKPISSVNNTEVVNSFANVERGCQASISDDELTCDNMKTTATQVDMDSIHSSEEDDDNEGKLHKLRYLNERKTKNFEKTSSVDEDDESSRDSVHLQIVDDLAADEPPQLPVKSAPVMQFIDHHGLDLLVDSIEEFAAREESSPPIAEPVNGLQLLSVLAEQRSLEERSVNETNSALRRHSVDSNPNKNGFNSYNQTINEFNALKRRQRSESCFTTNPNKFDENDRLFSDIKKLMKTSGCQTDDRRIGRFDSFVNLRRSERIFINDSVVSNPVKDVAIDVIKDKDPLSGKELKRKDGFENKCEVVSNDSKPITSEKNVSNSEQSVKAKPKDQYVFTGTKCDDWVPDLTKFAIINNKTKTNNSLVFCDIKPNNQKIGSDLSTDSKKDDTIQQQKNAIKKKKERLLSLTGSPNVSPPFDEINCEKRVKKKKKRHTDEENSNKKKLKTDYNKQIDDSIETIIKRVAQIDESIDGFVVESKPFDCLNKEKIITEDVMKADDNKVCDEQKDSNKKKRPLVKTSHELYDQKRMKLLDETIDEIIAKELEASELNEKTIETNDEIVVNVEQNNEITEQKTTSDESSVIPLPPKELEEPPKPVGVDPEPKTKPLVKQSSTCSTASTSSSITSSLSESCHSTTSHLNLKLFENDLDLKLNVIMLVDRLLFVGEICPIQPPDIYGIVLHGERQHRPIIYCQEEILKEAIREVKPSLEELEEGQRVCAYWSTQYRHLYPGFVRSSSPHPNSVFVEFDDGDNGRISIDDIRLLPQDYPQMKINADPLKNLERRRRMSSTNKDNRKHNLDNSSGNKIEEKKMSTEEMSKTIKNKTSDESKPNSMKDSNKKDRSLKTKSNKSSNTSSDKIITSHESSTDRMSTKSDSKKKKKKHNKEDRHHRHHHNHKHHHCRHHRKCKKHKKSKEENSSNSSSGSPNSLQNDSNDKTNNSDDKSCENSTKTIKLVTMKSTPKESKSLDDSIDAQNGSTDNQNDNKTTISSNSGDNNHDISNRTPLKTVIKKTAKQRALDRLQTNLSETFLTISSPVRKRYSNEKNSTTTVSAPTPKKRERMPSAEKSKIAAFLPERQIWHWSGKYIRRTGNRGSRNRKIYYREIERGREHIRVDDCAVFLSTGRPNLPYIGRIDSMWQTGSGTMIVKVRWFYHPEETKGQPVPLLDKRGALFESSHFDVNDVQTISHKCQVISWTEYKEKRSENPLIVSEDPPNVYYMAGQYDALAGHVNMDPTVPLKDTKPKDQISGKSEKTETQT